MTTARPEPVAWLAVVCTDKGTHQRTRLCDVRWHPEYPGGQWYATEAGPQPDIEGVHRSWEVLYPESDPDQWLYEFYCRRCQRNPRIGRAKWDLLMQGLHPKTWSDGELRRDLDLSLLPF